MIYTFTPGNIASVLQLSVSDGTQHTLIYMAEGKPVQNGIHNNPAFDTFPLKVRAEVNRHFGMMFLIPLANRGKYLSNCLPWFIKAEQEGA